MVKRMAMVLNGVVQEVAVWDGITPWNPGDQYFLVDVTDNPKVESGYIYVNGVFSAPAPTS